MASRPLTAAVNAIVRVSPEGARTSRLPRETCGCLCSRGRCLLICPVSSHCCGWESSQHHMAEHTHFLFSESLLFQEKLSTELLGITAAVSDHGEQIFPTGCFSFQLPGDLVVSTFRPCHFIVSWKSIWVRHLASNIIFVQNDSQCPIVSPLITEMGRLETSICVFFSALNPVTSHFACPEEGSRHLWPIFLFYIILFLPHVPSDRWSKAIKRVPNEFPDEIYIFLMGKECFRSSTLLATQCGLFLSGPAEEKEWKQYVPWSGHIITGSCLALQVPVTKLVCVNIVLKLLYYWKLAHGPIPALIVGAAPLLSLMVFILLAPEAGIFLRFLNSQKTGVALVPCRHPMLPSFCLSFRWFLSSRFSRFPSL